MGECRVAEEAQALFCCRTSIHRRSLSTAQSAEIHYRVAVPILPSVEVMTLSNLAAAAAVPGVAAGGVAAHSNRHRGQGRRCSPASQPHPPSGVRHGPFETLFSPMDRIALPLCKAEQHSFVLSSTIAFLKQQNRKFC